MAVGLAALAVLDVVHGATVEMARHCEPPNGERSVEAHEHAVRHGYVVTVAMLPEMAAAFMAEWEGERTPWFDLLRPGSNHRV